jgi:hypothetical protein
MPSELEEEGIPDSGDFGIVGHARRDDSVLTPLDKVTRTPCECDFRTPVGVTDAGVHRGRDSGIDGHNPAPAAELVRAARLGTKRDWMLLPMQQVP